MKRNNIFRIGGTVILLLVVAVIAVLSGGLIIGAGATLAITGAVVGDGIPTVEAVKAGSPTLDKDYVSKKVCEMRPAATPLDTIMRSIRVAQEVKAFKDEFYAVDSRPLFDTVKTQYTKSGDGHTSTDLVVNNISMWAADDTCFFPTITGVDNKPLVCFIVSKNNETTSIKIQPLNGSAGANTTANKVILPATIPVATRVVRMAPAKNEKDAQTTPYAILPVKSYNYMQIFMAQVEEGTYQRLHQKEVDWTWSDYEAQNIYDLRATMEFAAWFGVRAQFYDVTNNVQRYTMGGVTRYITKGLNYGTGGLDRTIDNATFVDWTKSIFTGNSGADTRYLFGGDGLMANLMKVDTILKQIEAKKTEVKFGVTFRQIETNFGILNFKHTPIFDQAGWGDNGVVLDLNFIEKHTFKPMDMRKLDLKAAGTRNTDATVIEECSTIITRYPDCHAIISPTA